MKRVKSKKADAGKSRVASAGPAGAGAREDSQAASNLKAPQSAGGNVSIEAESVMKNGESESLASPRQGDSMETGVSNDTESFAVASDSSEIERPLR